MLQSVVLVFVSLSSFSLASSENVSTVCPPWFFHNSTSSECQCYRKSDSDIECTDTGVLIGLGHCMTYEGNQDDSVYFAKCFYFQLPRNSVAVDNHIMLPRNVSELNDFMCGGMNRQGIVCSECIDDFGPSATSFGYKCTKCSDSWSGVIIYLLVDFGAVTVMYFIILLFRINMTTAPMTCFILYSQLVFYAIFKDPRPLIEIVEQSQSKVVEYILIAAGSFYGIWNLDPLRYAIPPHCISTKLSIIHIEFLGCVSALYALSLIFLTWVFIELRDRNFQLFVILWKPFHGCLVKLRRQYDIKEDMIDVFATFLLLTYSKFVYQSVQILAAQNILKNGLPYKKVHLYDPTIEYMSKEHLPFVIVSLVILIVFVIPPPLILLLYPTRAFRWCLTKCNLEGRCGIVLYTFVEKFYGCYRDTLNGGRDMRYFSALYFLLRPALVLLYLIRTRMWHNSDLMWFFGILLFASVSLLTAFIKPYKKVIVNLSDTLLLANLALLCSLKSAKFKYTYFAGVTFFFLLILPMIVCVFVIFCRFIHKFKAIDCHRSTKGTKEENDSETPCNTDEYQGLLTPSQNHKITSSYINI